MSITLRADRVFTGTELLENSWVELAGSTITRIGSGVAPDGAIDLGNVTLAPGYVDIHCHGGGGQAFGAAGQAGVEAAHTILKTHLRTGTTTMVGSFVTGGIEELAQGVAALGPLVADGTLAGVHLEGPWLSVAHKGAHNPDLLVAPTPQDIAQIFDAYPGTVKMVTIAPELDGGLDAVRDFVARGAIAAVGHTDADYDMAGQAIDAGSDNVTHLFNAMNSIHHRIPGPIIKFLEDDRITVELIADGVHSHPAIVAHAAQTVGSDRVILVTDAMAATGMSDGDYMLGSLEVEVIAGVARLKSNGSIAGSTLTMERAVQFCVQEAGLDLVAALKAATVVPARALGRTDIGLIAAGATANLVVLNPDLTVAQVYQNGVLAVQN